MAGFAYDENFEFNIFILRRFSKLLMMCLQINQVYTIVTKGQILNNFEQTAV